MKFTYLGVDFNLDDEIVRRRAERFGDTEEDISKYLTPYVECTYGRHINFYLEERGKQSLENEFNDYIETDLDLTNPV